MRLDFPTSRLSKHDTAQKQETDEVRQGHERIHEVGEVPHHAEFKDTTKEDGSDVEHAICPNHTASAQVLDSSLAIVAPSQYGAEGKGNDAEGKERSADIGYLTKSHLGKRAAIVEVISGYASTLETMTRPVRRQMTTVSQNVPELETRAWWTGFFV